MSAQPASGRPGLPATGRLAIYDAPNKPFEIRALPIRPQRASYSANRLST